MSATPAQATAVTVAEAPLCPYCGNKALLTDSAVIYGNSYGMIWLCTPCNAYVGVHKNSRTYKPLGRLANKELRKLKRQAHAAFDPLWKKKMKRDQCAQHVARNAGYKWLSEQMGIPGSECHIGMFDEQQCKMVIEICQKYL